MCASQALVLGNNTLTISEGATVVLTEGDLTPATLGRVVEEAVAQWAAMGVDPIRLGALSRIDVRIVDLPDSLLGLAYSNSIVIDRDAAGYGWSTGSSPVLGAVDLLTGVTHELGHVLGFDHDAGYDVMAASLAPGISRRGAPIDLAGKFTPSRSRV